MYNGEKTVSSISGAWKTGQLYVKKKNEISIFSSTYTKINLKWLKDQQPYKTSNHTILQENIENVIFDIDLALYFSKFTQFKNGQN